MSGRAAAPVLLVADPQPEILERLIPLLTSEGYEVEPARSAAAVIDAVETRGFDGLLLDLALAREAEQAGRDLLAELASRDTTLPLLVLTGFAGAAATALRRGAWDFVQKPWDDARLVATVRTNVELARALRRQQRLEAENEILRPQPRAMLVADAPAMKPVVDLITRVAASAANVLITGESGTGKATVAHAIHALSTRSSNPFITITSSTLAQPEAERVLFGEAGPGGLRSDRIGLFELADGGTLFVDEAASLPASTQPAMLRALESGEFAPIGSPRIRRASTRVISSTVTDLHAEAAAGRFRQDLLFRLGTVEIALPPLRGRREDIPALAHQFLRQHADRHRRTVTGFEHAAIQALLAHEWPGNIRELDHAVERGVLMAPGAAVRVADLGLPRAADAAALLDDMSLEHVEMFLIGKALARFEGNVSQAARALGLSRSALYRRLQRYGL